MIKKRMVGMDAQLIYEDAKENDGAYGGESLEPCAHVSGDVVFHSEDSGTPPSAIGEGNTKGSTLCPITPIPDRECPRPESPPNVGWFQFKRKEEGVASAIDCSPRTPEKCIFDPFAPGPEEMCLAPICKRIMKDSRKIVVRRLIFDEVDDDCPAYIGDSNNVDSLSEEMLLESVYGALLEAIILKQSEEFYAENELLEMKIVHTPKLAPPSTGVAETCPGAPMKVAASKSRDIDPGLCRKLEF